MAEHVVTFRQGVNGYTGTVDTQLSESSPTQSYASTSVIGVDRGTGENQQVLLRFDDILSQIPPGATIVSATLTLQTTNTGNGASLYRMLGSWSDTSTWSSLGNGVQANNVEARSVADLATGSTSLGASAYNVTSSVLAWAAGAANNGWVFVSQGSNGWDFQSAQGSTPPQLSITYSVPDGPANTLPVAVNDVAVVAEDGSTVISVLTNDSDADGHALSVTGAGAAAHGTVVVNQNGTITYTPTANYSGSDSFTYTISDGNGGIASATVNVTVSAVNDAPVANADAAQVNAGGSVVVNVLSNDTDIDGAALSVSALGTPEHGTVSLNQNGTVTYTPTSGYVGPDSFQYTLSDGNGGTATGTVSVTVFPVNSAPVANSDAVSLNEDVATVINVLGNDTDAEGQPLTVSGVGQPAHGTVVINQDGTVTYTPTANYSGADSFSYSISDGQGGTANSTVSLTVNPVNDNPVANADSGTVQAGNAVSINVLSNDTDAEANPLAVTGVGSAAHGTVVLNQDGTVTYTAATGYAGPDSFTYSINDGQGGTATSTVGITVTAPPGAWVEKQAVFKQGTAGYTGTIDTQLVQSAANTSYGDATTIGVDRGTNANVQVLLQFNDIFGDLASQVPAGAEILSATLTLNTTNTGDGATLHRMLTGWTEGSTWNSLVTGVQTNNVEARTLSDATVSAGSTGNTVFDVTSSILAWLSGQTNFGWVFVSRGSNGWDFTSSEGGNAPQLTINYRIPAAANTPPVATADTSTVAEDSSVVISVLANDTDADGNALTVTSVGTAAHGTVVLNPNGTVTYTPTANYSGPDSFTYTISDGNGGTATATAEVTVTPVNDNPVATGDTVTVTEDVATIINVLANDTDIDGNPLSVSAVGNAAHGTVVINQNGTITYTPASNYSGPDSFTYTISDGNGGTSTGTVTITVTPVNDAPVGGADSATTNQDQAIVISVLGNDTDVEGNSLAVAGITTGPAHGTAVVNQDGTITYTPTAGYFGPDSFVYQVSDGQGGTALATVTLTVVQVIPENTPPVAVTDTVSVAEDGSAVISVLGNDTDVDNNTLTVTGIGTAPAHGTVVINQDGTITYTPDGDYNGPDSFTYTISDGEGGMATGTVDITVTPVNDLPVAATDTSTASEDGSVIIDVLANDSDLEGGTLSVSGLGTPSHGTVVLNQDGTVTYTPAEDYSGPDSFTYTLSDGQGGTATGTVNVTVDPINDNPVAVNDTITVDEDSTIGIAVLANDTDIDGNPLSVSGLGAASHGTVVLNQDGTVTYTPTANYSGPDSFTYTISDGNGGTSTATVNLTVNPLPDAPVAANDSASVQPGNAVVINVLQNDSDPDGNPLTVTGIPTGPAHGTVLLNGDGTITYTANSGYSGSDSFIYTISDGQGGVSLASVIINVNQDGLEDSYIATRLTSGSARNLEHGNASKSFYANGTWWAVLPDGANWSIHRYDGSTPAPNTQGGWSIASDALFSNSSRSELAWDEVNQKLYVLSYSSSSSEPHLKQMTFNEATQTWQVDIDVQLAGDGGVLAGSEWGNNVEMSLGLDQNGVPILTAIAASSQGEKGLHVAFATSADLSTWGTSLVDANTKGLGGSNGNSKADIIHFTQDGVDRIGIFYSRDGSGSDDDWSFAWHDTASDTTTYGGTWNVEVASDQVDIDNHMSAVSDGEFIYALIKDDNDAIWLLKGRPGAWDAPYLVVDGGEHNPSRPTVVLDETNDQIYVFYQESTSNPEGQIYMKVFDTDNPVFDPEDLGTLIMEGPGSDDFLDPQSPAHSVGDHTGGYFLLLAKNEQRNEVWYNDIMLGGDHQIV
ncbi:beta strand repeat-containing protein [Devosia sp.]|uniref:beta strand repeat-containing protein n=1 Tax=Devosia sp. TaxID=1871048 RepID=UPI00292CFEA6|nr:Ig-like domain-containing protein [Devosia sp.]